MDFSRQREEMVRNQLVARGIGDLRVLKAMRDVPRHLFIEESLRETAYYDMALPTADGQTISQPYMVAVMTELLELRGAEKVLEIGTGSGYQAAILAELSGQVFTMERLGTLAEKAAARLRSLGYERISVTTGDGTLGLPEEAPFDRIIVTAGTPEVPEPLIGQLAPDGILVAPVGERFSQILVKLIRTPQGLRSTYHTPCVFVPLVGAFGWKEE
ncbi:MAG: protein-L-isoaspartate(D-aspartate) O-methyltransferase [Nitrospiraceae bacterium]|nr:protein-L-isoaspartate(D-aspartate) O-methyltransferase [Nitrospiraceae bacterium]